MDRLTEKSHWPDGHWMIPLVRCTDESGNMLQDGQYVPQAVIDRLAAYEDTGLTPEEIRKSDEMLRAFIEHNKTTEYPRTLDWLLNICKAESEGRLIVLPCSLGTTVYRIHRVFGESSISEEGFTLSALDKDMA